MEQMGKRSGSVFFMLLFSVHCITTILIDSMIPVTGTMIKVVRVGLLLGLLCMLLFRNEFLGLRYIAFSAVIGIIFAAAAVWSGKDVLLITVLLVLAARGQDFRETCRTYFYAVGGTVAVIFILCLLGVIEDYTYPHGDEFAHGLGFIYYSTPAFLLFILQMVWMYLRQEKIRWWELAVCAAANVLFYRLFSVRLTFLLGLFMLVLYAVMVKWHLFDPAVWWIKGIALTGYGALTALILWISASYNADHPSWAAWNTRLNNRLVMLNEAFRRFSFSPKGNKFEMVGQTFVINGGATTRDYFYIDSGLGYSVFAFGLLFTVLIVILFTYLYLEACRNRDRTLFIWISLLLLFTFMNNIWIDLAYNPLLLAVVPMLEQQGILRRAI